MLIKSETMHFDPVEVEYIAEQLQDNDTEGWTYKVKHDPKGIGKSIIQVFDEEGVFVHNF